MWLPLQQPLQKRLQSAGLSMSAFAAPYNKAIPLTMNLCEEVMANCFVNKSYDPRRNGTCPTKIAQFHLGFDWQNGLHGGQVKYPFF